MNEETESKILSELTKLRKDVSALTDMVMAIEQRLDDRIFRGKPLKGPPAREIFQLRKEIESFNKPIKE